MSAEETVAEFLIDSTSGCFGMLIAEILPIQINDENKFFVPIRSHFWRRQELCLVTISNIVVHSNVVKKMIIDISSSNSSNEQNILIEIIQLSFSCVLFGENFGVEAQFTSVLVASFQFLRNLTYSLNLLICENETDLSDRDSDTDDNNEIISREIEKAYSTSATLNLKRNQSESDSGEIVVDEDNAVAASTEHVQEQHQKKIANPLKFIADEILNIVSKPEVVQNFGMILASSCNEDLLNKMSRLLTVLLELSSDLEFEGLVRGYGQLTFLYCTKEH